MSKEELNFNRLYLGRAEEVIKKYSAYDGALMNHSVPPVPHSHRASPLL